MLHLRAFFNTIYFLLQNKHTGLAENGENLMSAQPRMSRASGSVQGKHSQSRKSIFKLGKEDMIHMISNVEGQSEDGDKVNRYLLNLKVFLLKLAVHKLGQ